MFLFLFFQIGICVFLSEVQISLYSESIVLNVDILLSIETWRFIEAETIQPDCHDIAFWSVSKGDYIPFWTERCSSTHGSNSSFWLQMDLNAGENQVTIRMNSTEIMVDYHSSHVDFNGSFFTGVTTTACPPGGSWGEATELDDLFLRANSEFTTQLFDGGEEEHSHFLNIDSETSSTNSLNPLGTVDQSDGESIFSKMNHVHYTDPLWTTHVSNNPQYFVEVKFCKNSLFDYVSGSIGLFTMDGAQLPSGWSLLSNFDGRYVKGLKDSPESPTYVNRPINVTHSTALGSVRPDDSSNQLMRVDAAPKAAVLGHIHSIPEHLLSATAHNWDLPGYKFVFAENDGTGEMVPGDTLSIASAVPPMGWERFDAADGMFLMGGRAGGSHEGVTEHTHGVLNEEISTGAPETNENYNSGGNNNYRTLDDHKHTITVQSTEPASHVPRYKQVVLVRRKESNWNWQFVEPTDPVETCPEDCGVCDDENSSVCLLCEEGFFEFEGVCLDNCPLGTLEDSLYRRCVEDCSFRECMDEHCESCISFDICTNCSTGYYLYENECVRFCPPEHVVHENECVAETDLDPVCDPLCPSFAVCVSDQECVCIDGYFPNPTPHSECLPTPICEGGCEGNSECVMGTCMCVIGTLDEYPDCGKVFPPPSFEIQYEHVIGSCSSASVNLGNVKGNGVEFSWETNATGFILDSSRSYMNLPRDMETGFYFIEVTCTDIWDRSVVERVYFEKSGVEVPLLRIAGPQVIYAFPSSVLELTSFVESECSETVDFAFHWEAVESSHPIDFSGVDTSSNSIVFLNGFPILNGEHRIKVTATSQFGSSSKEVHVIVLVRDFAILLNDSNRAVPTEKEIAVDSSSSYDPEDADIPHQINWRLSYSPNGVDFVLLDESLFRYEGTLVQFVPHFVGHYLLECEVVVGDRSSLATIVYESFAEESGDYVPVVWIDQFTQPVNPSERISIRGNIQEHEKASEVSFLWECVECAFDLTDAILSESLESLVLVLKPDVLQESTIFRLGALYGRTEVYSSILVKVPLIIEANTGGSANVVPKSNVALQYFHVFFNEWEMVFASTTHPLHYRVTFIHCITNEEVIATQWTTQDNFKFTIATPGCQTNAYEIDLLLQVSDGSGRIMTEIQKVSVLPFDYESAVRFIVDSANLIQAPCDFTIVDRFGCIYEGFNRIQNVLYVIQSGDNGDVKENDADLVSLFLSISIDFVIDEFIGFDGGVSHHAFLDSGRFMEIIQQLFHVAMDIFKSENDKTGCLGRAVEILEVILVEYPLSSALQLEDLQDLREFIEFLYRKQTIDEEKYLELSYAILRFLITEISCNEKNEYLNNDGDSNGYNVSFAFIKDYAINYKSDLPPDGFGKREMELREITILIPPEVADGYQTYDVINTVSYSSSDQQIQVNFLTNSGELIDDTVLHDPISIVFPFMSDWGNSPNVQCTQSNSSYDGYCDSSVDPKERTVKCQCNKVNKFYSLSLISEGFVGLVTNPALKGVWVIPFTLGICLLVLVATVFCILAVPLLMKQRRKKLKIMISNDDMTVANELNECQSQNDIAAYVLTSLEKEKSPDEIIERIYNTVDIRRVKSVIATSSEQILQFSNEEEQKATRQLCEDNDAEGLDKFIRRCRSAFIPDRRALHNRVDAPRKLWSMPANESFEVYYSSGEDQSETSSDEQQSSYENVVTGDHFVRDKSMEVVSISMDRQPNVVGTDERISFEYDENGVAIGVRYVPREVGGKEEHPNVSRQHDNEIVGIRQAESVGSSSDFSSEDLPNE